MPVQFGDDFDHLRYPFGAFLRKSGDVSNLKFFGAHCVDRRPVECLFQVFLGVCDVIVSSPQTQVLTNNIHLSLLKASVQGNNPTKDVHLIQKGQQKRVFRKRLKPLSGVAIDDFYGLMYQAHQDCQMTKAQYGPWRKLM